MLLSSHIWCRVGYCGLGSQWFHPDLERSGDQSKKKFDKISRTNIPTGNPNTPPTMREAKEIRELIMERPRE
jgi:hypothetical protein